VNLILPKLTISKNLKRLIRLFFQETTIYQKSLSSSSFLGGGNVSLKIITKNIAAMPAIPIHPMPFTLPDRPAESARNSVVVKDL
jgi:hypothetical protein